MQVFEGPVRINCAIKLGTYTYRDAATRRTINLEVDFVAVSVECHVKAPGMAYTTETGAFVSKPSGMVHVATYTPTVVGVYQYQFFCIDATGNRLPGEPVQFEVFENIEDASVGELLKV